MNWVIMSWLLKNHIFKMTLAGVAVNVSDAAMGFLLARSKRLNLVFQDYQAYS